MRFEFDSAKSAANKEKHGIDFVEAQALWSDPDRLERPARSSTEPRRQVIGRIQQTVWSAFITYRNAQENRTATQLPGGEQENVASDPARATTRIISVRRAREEEVRRYRDLRVGRPRGSDAER